MARTRFKMKLDLTSQPVEQRRDCRAISTGWLVALSQLMLDAYRGTIDDNEETLEDAIKMTQDTFAGGIGPFLKDCSWLIERDGKVLACTLLTLWRGEPLLAEVLTDPSAQNQGLGAFLIKKSINALLARGYSDLTLFVTKGNLPAQHLYEKLGFQVIEEIKQA